MAGGRKYPDLRYLFMRGLIAHEGSQRSRHYLKSAAECTARAIVSLELAEEPIKSIKQAKKLEGIGGETCTRLTKLASERNYNSLKPLAGRFVSSCGGILVALLDATDEALYSGHSQDGVVLVPEETVKRRAKHLTEEQFLDDNVEGFCKAWWRIEVLVKRGYIRRRSLKKSPVLQLLPIGKEAAQRLRESVGLSTPVPSVPKLPAGTVSQRTSTSASSRSLYGAAPTLLHDAREVTGAQPELQEDALYTNDTGKDGIVLLVDIHEMGGDRVGLGELCGLLQQSGICYKTRQLKSGDYSWFWRCNGREIILPCLIERKRADDMAGTLKEGRFWSQVNKMVAWKQAFTTRGVECSLQYVLERKPEEYVVQCPDACQGVGMCGNPSLTQVKNAVQDLKKHPDLLVKETDSLEITVMLLASFTAELEGRLERGDFDNLLQQEIMKSRETKKRKRKNKHQDNQDLKHPLDIDDDNLLAAVIEKSKFETGIKKEHSTELGLQTQLKQDLDSEIAKHKPIGDMSFEEELQLALELSKKDTAFNMHDRSNSHFHGGSNKMVDNFDISKCSSKARTVGVDEAIDIDIEQAIINPSHDTGEIPDRLSHPLMQYHFSTSRSVNYPTSRTPTKVVDSINVYRPTINRKRSFTSTLSSENVETPKSPEVTGRLSAFKSYSNPTPNDNSDVKTGKWDCVTESSGVSRISTNTTSSKAVVTERSYMEDMNYPWLREGDVRNTVRQEVKDKHKPLFEDPHQHDFLISATSLKLPDDTSIINKNPKTIKLNFTPSELFTETNIVNTPQTQTKKGKIYRMRLDKKHSSSIREINDRKCRSESEKCNIPRSKDCMFSDKCEIGLKSDACTSVADAGTSVADGGTSVTDVGTGVADRHAVEDLEDEIESYKSDEDLFDTVIATDRNSKLNETVVLSDKLESFKECANVRLTPKDTFPIRSPSSERSSPESLPDLPSENFDLNLDGQDKRRDLDDDYNPPGPSRVRNDHNVRRSLESFDTFDTNCHDTAILKEENDRSVNTIDSTKMSGNGEKRYDSGYDSETRQDRKNEEKIQTILSILPQISRLGASAVLQKHSGNVEACICALLEDGPPSGVIVDLTDSQNT